MPRGAGQVRDPGCHCWEDANGRKQPFGFGVKNVGGHVRLQNHWSILRIKEGGKRDGGHTARRASSKCGILGMRSQTGRMEAAVLARQTSLTARHVAERARTSRGESQEARIMTMISAGALGRGECMLERLSGV